jgi:uncharacterized membrane protein YbhN (UPF0104 family)
VTRSAVWSWLKIGLAVALCLFVISQTDLHELMRLGRQLALPWLLPSFLLYFALIMVTARRAWLLVERRTPFLEMVSITVLQTVVGNLVATSVGVASYIAMLRGRHQIQVRHGVASVLLARFGDLLVLLVALALTSAVLWKQIEPLQFVVGGLLASLTVAGGIVALAIFQRTRFVSLARTLLTALKLADNSAPNRIASHVEQLGTDSLGLRGSTMLAVLSYSLLSFGLQLVFGYCNMQLFNVSIGIWQMAFVMTMAGLLALVPIQVFGGLGVAEISAYYLYGLFVPDLAFLAAFVIGSRLYFYLLNASLLSYFVVEPRLVSQKIGHPHASGDQAG